MKQMHEIVMFPKKRNMETYIGKRKQLATTAAGMHSGQGTLLNLYIPMHDDPAVGPKQMNEYTGTVYYQEYSSRYLL